MNKEAKEAVESYRELKKKWESLSEAQKLLHKHDCPYRDTQEKGWQLNDD